jgi:hypothetical protein
MLGCSMLASFFHSLKYFSAKLFLWKNWLALLSVLLVLFYDIPRSKRANSFSILTCRSR